ncbi:MAG: arylesterase [Deltaproteobacteria bacterium]|nr:arylesterase [Deltaproteobacteria bacterium]
MRKIISVFLKSILLLILFLLSSCTPSSRLLPLSPDARVLAFGDSITYGTGAAESESYPAVLQNIISRTVINAGIPGETTAEGLTRLPSVIDEHRPALMILCLGGNDFLLKLDEGEAKKNLREMVRLAKEKGVDVILIGVPRLGLSLTVPEFYGEIAGEFGIPYEGNILRSILSKGGLKSDYIHPNAQGYRKMAEAIAELLRKSGAVR